MGQPKDETIARAAKWAALAILAACVLGAAALAAKAWLWVLE